MSKNRVKNLTREQKLLIAKQGLNPKMWQLVQEYPNHLQLKHRVSGNTRVICKLPRTEG